MYVEIIVSDVPVRNGLLLLTVENTVVLGGQVGALVMLEEKKREKWANSQKYLFLVLVFYIILMTS